MTGKKAATKKAATKTSAKAAAKAGAAAKPAAKAAAKPRLAAKPAAKALAKPAAKVPAKPAAKAGRKRLHDEILKELRTFGLAYPGAHLKSPWPGHLDLAVKDKTFAYLSIEGEPFGISCKLPHSCAVALMFPFANPTGYGLGKSGWVSAKFAEDEVPPVELLRAWIDESYRAQAPKKLVASLPPPRG